MGRIVQKYGGSSVADVEKIRNVATRVKEAHDEGSEVVVVVSAMGDTTDDLIARARSVSPSREPRARELDLLLSTGELVSCSLLTMALLDMDCDAISLSGPQAGIHTDTTFGRARISGMDVQRVEAELESGRVVVVAGFQGITDEDDITTLGRGGSDTTAVAIAGALGADRCEIYTDVDGIYTADPRIVPAARKLDEIAYYEMLELASLGAKMHPRAIELGSVFQVPILVASSFNKSSGTLIKALQGTSLEEFGGFPIVSGPPREDRTVTDQSSCESEGKNGASRQAIEDRIRVRGISYRGDVSRITVKGVPDEPGMVAALFEPLAESGVNVGTIVQNTGGNRATDVSFTVNRAAFETALDKVRETALATGATGGVDGKPDSGAVAIVGSGMLNSPGFASQMFRALGERRANIDMISTSEISTTCIISNESAVEAVRGLNDSFGFHDKPFDPHAGTLPEDVKGSGDVEDAPLKITGVAYKDKIAKITVRSVPDQPGLAGTLFAPLSEAGVSVDTIVQNTAPQDTGAEPATDISFTVSSADLPAARAAIQDAANRAGAMDVDVDTEIAAVSIVGSAMRVRPGFAARMFRLLADADVNIDMITTSEISLTCIIPGEKLRGAVARLHEGFQLDRA